MDNLEPLFKLIKKYESTGAVASQKVSSEYDVVFGGIRPSDRPQSAVGKYLTQMTVGEVLAWQASIDAKYNSEAAGAYQIMEDTLKTLLIGRNQIFNKLTQDELCVELLKRRKLNRWLEKTITDVQFANELAKEWASLPVIGGPKHGQSYYGGVGANKYFTPCTPEEVLDTLKEVRNNSEKLSSPVIPTDLEARVATLEEELTKLKHHLRSI